MPAGSALTFAQMHFVMSVDEPPTGMEAHDCSFPPPADFPIVQVEQRPSLPALVIKRKRSVARMTEDKSGHTGGSSSAERRSRHLNICRIKASDIHFLLVEYLRPFKYKQMVLQPKRE